MMRKYMMVPELKGIPSELTKNNSKPPAKSTIPGIITYIITDSISNETIPANKNPLVEVLYLL